MRITREPSLLLASFVAATPQTVHAQIQERPQIHVLGFVCQMQNGQPRNVHVTMRTRQLFGWYRFDFFGRSAAESRGFTVDAGQMVYHFSVPGGVFDIGVSWTPHVPPSVIEHQYRLTNITLPAASVAPGGATCQATWPPGQSRETLLIPFQFVTPGVERVEYFCESAPGGPRTVRLFFAPPSPEPWSVQIRFVNLADGHIADFIRGPGNRDYTFAVPTGDYQVVLRWFGTGAPLDLNTRASEPRMVRVPPIAGTGGRGTGCRLNWPPGMQLEP